MGTNQYHFHFAVAACAKKNCTKRKTSDTKSMSSRLSCNELEVILEHLKYSQNRESTRKNYLTVWRKFNAFLIRLDKRPKFWEDRASLFGTHLVNEGFQSSTLKSYIFAIKHVVKNDGYNWDDSKVLLYTLARACKQKNDSLRVQLLIQLGLFEMLLYELGRLYDSQPYLCCLFRAIFSLAYYGLMRIGELVSSQHTLKAKDVHMAINKNKLMVILYSSKMHDRASAFCPFKILRTYIKMRGDYTVQEEQFFLFSDKSQISPNLVQSVLQKLIDRLNLGSSLYGTHSFRISHGSDLIKYGFSIEQIKRMGQWKSNAVYKYLRS